KALPNVGGEVPNSIDARSIVHLIGLCFTEGIPDFLRYLRLKIEIFAIRPSVGVGAIAPGGPSKKDPTGGGVVGLAAYLQSELVPKIRHGQHAADYASESVDVDRACVSIHN